MKKILFACLLVLQSLIGGQAAAAPCVTSPLVEYQKLLSGGCTVGSLNFSDFSLLTEPTAATPFRSIQISPLTSGGLFGLTFSITPFSVVDTSLFENLIAYRVTGIGALLNGATIALLDATATDSGSVTNVQNLCLGGAFGPDGVSGCMGKAVNQIAIVTDGLSDPIQTAAFAAIGALAVATDIAIDGGGKGTASLGSTTNLFRSVAVVAVPEPAPIFLLCAGVLAFAVRRPARRRAAVRLA